MPNGSTRMIRLIVNDTSAARYILRIHFLRVLPWQTQPFQHPLTHKYLLRFELSALFLLAVPPFALPLFPASTMRCHFVMFFFYVWKYTARLTFNEFHPNILWRCARARVCVHVWVCCLYVRVFPSSNRHCYSLQAHPFKCIVAVHMYVQNDCISVHFTWREINNNNPPRNCVYVAATAIAVQKRFRWIDTKKAEHQTQAKKEIQFWRQSARRNKGQKNRLVHAKHMPKSANKNKTTITLWATNSSIAHVWTYSTIYIVILNDLNRRKRGH